MTCTLPQHNEQEARSIAFVYNEKREGKWVAERCKECLTWHVMKREKRDESD